MSEGEERTTDDRVLALPLPASAVEPVELDAKIVSEQTDVSSSPALNQKSSHKGMFVHNPNLIVFH